VADMIVANINEICTLKLEFANNPIEIPFTKTFKINDVKYSRLNLIKCPKMSFLTLKVIFLFAIKEKTVPKAKPMDFAILMLDSKYIKL
jgi:hypothetical protein